MASAISLFFPPSLATMPRKRKSSGSSKPKAAATIAAATTNKFAALLLDKEGSREPGTKTEEGSGSFESRPAPNKGEEESGKKEDVAASAAATTSLTGRTSTPTPTSTTPRLRKPLFWLDLEMTGLDPSTDSILEIAVLVSDGLDLDVRIPGPSLAISASEETLRSMNAWCVDAHGKSGLTAKCLDGERSVPLEEAERLVCEFVERQMPPPREARGRGDVGGGNGNGNDDDGKKPPSSSSSSSPSLPPRIVQDRATLAGNSIHVDFSFLRRHMPRLASLCSHRLVDVSSFAEVARRWHPNAFYSAPSKQNAHEAMKDVCDSIDELKFYKEVMFKSAGEVTKAVARTGNPRRG